MDSKLSQLVRVFGASSPGRQLCGECRARHGHVTSAGGRRLSSDQKEEKGALILVPGSRRHQLRRTLGSEPKASRINLWSLTTWKPQGNTWHPQLTAPAGRLTFRRFGDRK